ncbi:MAG: hypothetical protein ACRC26_02045 [Bacteroidales bacterium]
MRKLLTLQMLVLFFFSVQAKGKILPIEGKAVILITSVDCGFCLKNTGFYNQLSQQYKGKIPFIALYESSAKKVRELPERYPGKDVELKDWEVNYSARRIYLKLVEYETYPQLLFINNGRVESSFIGTIDSVKNEINKHLPRFVGKGED